MKDVSFLKRSGFNKHIDDSAKLNVIDQPVSSKVLRNSTLKKQATKHLTSMVKQSTIIMEDQSDLENSESQDPMFKTFHSSTTLKGNTKANLNRTLTNISATLNDVLGKTVYGNSFALKKAVQD